MAATGLLDDIYDAATAIGFGRKGVATRGEERQGRIYYENGIAMAVSAFMEAKAAADPEKIIRVGDRRDRKNRLKQRRANLSVAEKSYMKKQGKAMSGQPAPAK